jgi:thioredoxin 1
MTDAATLPDVTDATFDEVLASCNVPLIVDFWATWCGPCHTVEPVLAEIAGLRRGELRIVRVDVDVNPDLARRYGVMSMPTLLLFAGGEPVLRLVGARGRGQLLAEIDRGLADYAGQAR